MNAVKMRPLLAVVVLVNVALVVGAAGPDKAPKATDTTTTSSTETLPGFFRGR